MSFHPNTPSPLDTGHVAAAIDCLRHGFYAQAFALLSDPRLDRNPAARFALGLCRLHATEFDAAISCFEQALHGLKAAVPQPASVAENTDTYHKLAARRIAEEGFLVPMDPDFCARFPKTAEQTALLALIHTYRKTGMHDQAQRLAAGLTGPAFEAYQNKLRGDSAHGGL